MPTPASQTFSTPDAGSAAPWLRRAGKFGFWFFCVLALWLALQWFERRSWWRAVLIQLAIGMAALFRLEAVFLLPVLACCLLPELNTRRGWLGRPWWGLLAFAFADAISAFDWLGGFDKISDQAYSYWYLLSALAYLTGYVITTLAFMAADDHLRLAFQPDHTATS